MNIALAWAGAFITMFLTDYFWALYVGAVQTRRPVVAGMWAVALFVMGGLAVIGYTSDHWLLVPAALGAFVGTVAGVWKQSR
jgi:hypothetical protein